MFKCSSIEKCSSIKKCKAANFVFYVAKYIYSCNQPHNHIFIKLYYYIYLFSMKRNISE